MSEPGTELFFIEARNLNEAIQVAAARPPARNVSLEARRVTLIPRHHVQLMPINSEVTAPG
jgi:hypothetical protein